ncbi:MAG: AI-2E family transporter [Clostridium argentinense]|nr:AI-2E family transporter [Clostridium argentinense]
MLKENKTILYLITINLILLMIFLLTKVNFIFIPLISLKDTILIPTILAVFLYYILRPINRFLKSKKLSNGLSTTITIVSVLLLLIGISTYASSTIAKESSSLVTNLTSSVQNLSNKYSYLYPKLNELLRLEELLKKTASFITSSFLDISIGVAGVVGSVSNFFAQLVLIPIIMFYILKDEYKLYNSFVKILPVKSKKIILKIAKEIDTVLKQYITAQMIVAFIIGALMFIGYIIIKMPNAFVLAFFAFITSFIPFLGPVLGVLPALIIALGIGFPMAVKIVILAVIVQQLEGNIITPNITGNQLHMYPLTTIIVITVSVYLGGFFAAFVAVPIYNILKILVKNTYEYYATCKQRTKERKISN